MPLNCDLGSRVVKSKLATCFTHLGGDRGLFVEGAFARHGGDDLPAVEAAVFDEDFAGVHSADDYAREINAGHVAFERFGIDGGFFVSGSRRIPSCCEKFEVGMIAGHGEHLRGGQGLLMRVGLHPHFAGLDARNIGVEQRRDLAGPDAIFDVGLHPIFRSCPGRLAMNQGDVRAGAK